MKERENEDKFRVFGFWGGRMDGSFFRRGLGIARMLWVGFRLY